LPPSTTSRRHTPLSKRGIQYAAAFRFHRWRLRNTGSSAFADDDSGGLCRGFKFSNSSSVQRTHLRILAAHFARVLLQPSALSRTEGAGNAGCPLHPQPRVRCLESTRVSHHRSTGFTQHSLRNGFNGLLRALVSLVTGLVCHHRFADWQRVWPGWAALASAKLDASVGASGPHDFAVRESCVRLAQLTRPPHPTATFVTIATRPSSAVRRADLNQ
jgi:hypothetical protein